MPDDKEFYEKHYRKECAHLREVAAELKLKSDASDLVEEVIYAELLAAFVLGRDMDRF